MRNISFMMTQPQVRARTKDVTRRNGWWNAKAGELLQGCEKCQGLGPGGKIVKLDVIELVDAREEPLRRMIDEPEYGADECRREGFPDMSPAEFVAFWCAGHKKTTPESTVMRLQFKYLWAPQMIERHTGGNTGHIFVVRADREFDRQGPAFIGWEAYLDGRIWKVVGRDCYMPATPIYPGEIIGLTVTPADRR